ncbi:hypothetical protein CDD83_5182 [Cordyceps sp. RAO-2017]|nr:hypothetical protein CDD83_5182 [Cordyceps sp. RAO-2017]
MADQLFDKFDKFYDKYETHLTPYVSGVDVVYSKTPPDNRLRDVQGHGDDINAYEGGNFVYLIPQYTNHADEACTSFKVRIETSSIPGLKDLANGAGGKYRYLTCEKRKDDKKIRRVALFRGSDDPTTLLDKDRHGFTNKTIDINEGRDGNSDIDFIKVYLIWGYDEEGNVTVAQEHDPSSP